MTNKATPSKLNFKLINNNFLYKCIYVKNLQHTLHTTAMLQDLLGSQSTRT